MPLLRYFWIALFYIKLRRRRWLTRALQLYARPWGSFVGPDQQQRALAQLTILWATQPAGLHSGYTPPLSEASDSDDGRWMGVFDDV